MSESNENEKNEQNNGHEFATQWRTRCLEPLMRSMAWFIETLEQAKEDGRARETENEINYLGHLANYEFQKIPPLEKLINPFGWQTGIRPIIAYTLSGGKLDDPTKFCLHPAGGTTQLPAGDTLVSLQSILMDDRSAFHLIYTLRDALVQLYGLGPSPITPELTKWCDVLGATYDPEMRTVEFAGTHGFRFRVQQTWPNEYVYGFKQRRAKNWRTFLVEALDESVASTPHRYVTYIIAQLSRLPGEWMADPELAAHNRKYVPLVDIIAARYAPLRRALAEVLADRTEED